jgi:hypothetical protein
MGCIAKTGDRAVVRFKVSVVKNLGAALLKRGRMKFRQQLRMMEEQGKRI